VNAVALQIAVGVSVLVSVGIGLTFTTTLLPVKLLQPLALTVKTSARYICSGSAMRSPSRNAGTGLVGIATTSTRSNARS